MGDLGNHTITVIQPAPADRYGDPQPGGLAETDVTGCYLQPGPSAELTGQRDTVTSEPLLFLPAGVDIGPGCRVRFGGVLYQVDGEPAAWADIDGVPHHIEAKLRRVTG